MLEVPDAKSPQELKQRLAALVPRHFSAAETARAAQLVERYVDYRVALSSLKPPRDMGDPKLLRDIIDARRKIRERHFGPEEYDALFAQEEELDRFTVARLEIARDASLTPAQKQAALQDAERGLSESQRAARSEATLHETVAAQTAALHRNRGARQTALHAEAAIENGHRAGERRALAVQNHRSDPAFEEIAAAREDAVEVERHVVADGQRRVRAEFDRAFTGNVPQRNGRGGAVRRSAA